MLGREDYKNKGNENEADINDNDLDWIPKME